MKRDLFLAAVAFAGLSASAQEMTDVYKNAKQDIVGSARFMGMAGAFGALGGDITTLSHNPAGIGVYRSSEAIVTLSIGGTDTKSTMPANGFGTEGPNLTGTKFNFGANNLGYVGTFKTGKSSGLINFNVGFAYNRQQYDHRKYRVTQDYMQSSLSDYIADGATNWGGNGASILIDNTQRNDPYYDTNAPWLTILGYNTGVIQDMGGGRYNGLYPNYAAGGDLLVEEKRRTDEYTFNVGGNFSNMVYWGVGVGVMDLNYVQRSFYDEFYWDTNNTSLTTTSYQLDNYLKTTGTGVNVKAGLIFKPTNAFRLGFAFHTPTWYHMTDRFDASMRVADKQSFAKWDEVLTPIDYFDYRIRTPWQYQFSAAYVVGKMGLLSFEYDMQDFSQNRLSDDSGFDDISGSFNYQNEDLRNQLKTINTFKVGSEIRLSPFASLRLGYANQSSGYKNGVKENEVQIYTAGTIPNYVIDRGTQYYTGGFGLRSGNLFTDLAFVWKTNKQDAYMFSEIADQSIFSTRSRLKTDTYSFLMSVGYKF